MVGIQKKGGTPTFALRLDELLAYHQAGRSVVEALILDYGRVQKIYIIT